MMLDGSVGHAAAAAALFRLCFHTYIVQLVVESARVADGLAVVISPPQRRLGRLAVGARGPLAAGGALRQKVCGK